MNWRFQEVTARASRTGKCPGCGGATRRTHTFAMTVNPFNKNEDGTVKTPEQVRADVQKEASEWVADHWHETCKGARS